DGHAQPDVADDRALLGGELAERALDAHRRPHRADRVVLGDPRHAERAHDAVAEELHDGAAVRVDRDAYRPVIAVHHAAHRLGIEPLVQRRGADEVGEDDRDDLARDGVVGGRRRGDGAERGPAALAEPCVGRALFAALGTTRSQRLTAAAAEPSPRAVPPAAFGAGHGRVRGCRVPWSYAAGSRARSAHSSSKRASAWSASATSKVSKCWTRSPSATITRRKRFSNGPPSGTVPYWCMTATHP